MHCICKKYRFVCLIVTVLFLMSSLTPCLAYERYDGNTLYRATIVGTSNREVPITSTQAQHTQGYETTISISTSVTTSQEESSSLSIGFSYFVEASVSLGVCSSESCTVEAGVSYTIPASKATGRFRISTAFPGHSVRFEIWNIETTERLDMQFISYMPDAGDSYYFLDEYYA